MITYNVNHSKYSDNKNIASSWCLSEKIFVFVNEYLFLIGSSIILQVTLISTKFILFSESIFFGILTILKKIILSKFKMDEITVNQFPEMVGKRYIF